MGEIKMKRIKLLKLILRNFKGIRNMEIDFDDLTSISGDNGTGKTTLYDGYTWLLFDKDSSDRQNFEIKTLEPNNEVIHGLEHEVTGILSVDGKKIKLTKIFKEKWTKKKGEAIRQLTCHETLYYVNEIPVKQSEYKEAINKILSEQLFKLICNPLYFNMNMKWQDRRNVIMDIIGDIPVERVLNYKKELWALKPFIKDMDIDTLKKSIAVKKRMLNGEINSKPPRIDELNKSIQEYDFDAIEVKIRQNQEYLKELEEEILGYSNMNEEMLSSKSSLYRLKDRAREIEHTTKAEAEKEHRELENTALTLDYEIKKIKRNIEDLNLNRCKLIKSVEELEETNRILKSRWYEEDDKKLEFDEQEFICPTCRRAFEEKDIEIKKAELIENFNNNKENLLNKISAEGVANNERINEYQLQIEDLDRELGSLQEKLAVQVTAKDKAFDTLRNFVPSMKLEDNVEYRELCSKIEEMELKEASSIAVEKLNILKDGRADLCKILDELKKKLMMKEQNEMIRVRINKLQEEERALAKQIAEQEWIEYLCEEYIKAKVELMESAINSKFRFVKFKLFNTLVNGTIEDCCEALVNGVPISNANRASQINGGLDIINALCSHYGVQAPVFIDNRESVNEILKCDSQVINLLVSRDKTLRIENTSMLHNNPTAVNGGVSTKLIVNERPIETIEAEAVKREENGRKYSRAEGPGF
jgi:DNA repair protein SbcC/Rad50